MHLDIRLPIGALFTALGLILSLYGMFGDAAANARSLGHNVNLSWGFVMLAFGILCLLLARRGVSTPPPSA